MHACVYPLYTQYNIHDRSVRKTRQWKATKPEDSSFFHRKKERKKERKIIPPHIKQKYKEQDTMRVQP